MARKNRSNSKSRHVKKLTEYGDDDESEDESGDEAVGVRTRRAFFNHVLYRAVGYFLRRLRAYRLPSIDGVGYTTLDGRRLKFVADAVIDTVASEMAVKTWDIRRSLNSYVPRDDYERAEERLRREIGAPTSETSALGDAAKKYAQLTVQQALDKVRLSDMVEEQSNEATDLGMVDEEARLKEQMRIQAEEEEKRKQWVSATWWEGHMLRFGQAMTRAHSFSYFPRLGNEYLKQKELAPSSMKKKKGAKKGKKSGKKKKR